MIKKAAFQEEEEEEDTLGRVPSRWGLEGVSAPRCREDFSL